MKKSGKFPRKYVFGLITGCALLILTGSASGSAMTPAHYYFYDSRQMLGDSQSNALDLGDLDADGDLDAFVASSDANTVWLNDGAGLFSDSGQLLGDSYSVAVALGDLDGDRDLDAFVGNRGSYAGAPDQVWLNDGTGQFTVTVQSLSEQVSYGVALGDVDGDEDLDAFVAACGPGYPTTDRNILWLNDGNAVFTESGQDFGQLCSTAVRMGYLNQDAYLDIIVGNAGSNTGIEIWLNDSLGTGVFSKTQVLDHTYNFGLGLGDVDGDGDEDLFVANGEAMGGNSPNTVWLNDGSGLFSDSGQRLGNSASQGVKLGDVDGDGDLDALVANGSYVQPQPNRVWLNDGSGVFSDSGQPLGLEISYAVALGDLDGAGDLDLYLANDQADTVWFGNRVLKEKLYLPIVLGSP